MPNVSQETLAASNSVAFHVLHCFSLLIVAQLSYPEAHGARKKYLAGERAEVEYICAKVFVHDE